MRIVSWNLAHQTQERRLKDRFEEAVRLLAPDVLILNEYVHGSTREPFVEALRSAGLADLHISELVGRNNQVLIASREAMHQGDLRGPTTASGAGESNFLHVEFPAQSVEVVGIRAPAYERTVDLRDYWSALLALMIAAEERSILFVGDFNADPDGIGHVGSKALASLRERGWQVPSPAGTHSYRSGSRIDHVAASPSVGLLSAEYINEIGGIKLCGSAAEAISDHAPIVVDLAVPVGQTAPVSQGAAMLA
jgi:exonuclease III